MTAPVPPGWHPDPFGRYEHRYWDGVEWTNQVATRGQQATDPPVNSPQLPLPPSGGPASKKVQRQVRRTGVTDSDPTAAPDVLTESVLVVNQKGKLFEVNAEYRIYDRHGRQVGACREVGQSFFKSATSSPRRTRRLQVLDTEGGVVMYLTRPTSMVRMPKVLVMNADGTEIGEITQKFTLGYDGFRLEANGKKVGSIKGENRQQFDFRIENAKGHEIGRITRTSAGVAKEIFTKADNYVVEIHRPLDEPLRSLVIAASLAVDTALRQR